MNISVCTFMRSVVAEDIDKLVLCSSAYDCWHVGRNMFNEHVDV